MTYVKELPVCIARFGRASMIEKKGRLIPMLTVACGYREVDPEECIICGGFTDTKLEMKIDTFIMIKKGKTYKCRSLEK